MRPLLVLTGQPPPDELRHVLESCHWALVPVYQPDQARKQVRGNRVYVGLMLLNADARREELDAWRKAIYALPALRWVAVMTRQQAEEPPMRQAIVERLYDYQVTPVDPMRLCHALGHAHGIAQIEQAFLTRDSDDRPGRYGMTGESGVMHSLYTAIERVAATDASVLIMGQTGTGKELVASAIHASSSRSGGPLVSLNCAAIPATLIQSELFGHMRGAFTSALATKPGLIETAHGGTLLLDEIGEMPLESQASLLRFLDNGRIHPVGADTSKQLDVRVIAATNRDLREEADRHLFRADLYYRLSVLTLQTPPLKDRGDDLELLADLFVQEARSRLNAPAIGLSQDALAALHCYGWPGNVRELRSRIYQASVNCRRRHIDAADLALLETSTLEQGRPLRVIREEAERKALLMSLARHGRNVAQAAQDLHISRMTMYRLMEKHALGCGEGAVG